MITTERIRSWKKSFAWLFGLSTLWAAFCAARLGLSDQEAYYWTWSTVPDWCYFEHPALQAWVSHALSAVLGDAPVVFRLPAFLLGRAAGMYFLWKWISQRYGELIALQSLHVLLSTFFIMAVSVIALPDAYLFPFVAMSLYFSEQRRPVGAGIALGLCGLAKWTGALIGPGVLAAFLWDRSRPLAERLRRTAGVAAIALVMQAPTFYWNAQHDWSAFRFHLQNRHPNFDWTIGQVAKNAAAFGFSQIALGGFGFLLLTILWLRYARRPATQKRTKPSSDSPLNWMPLAPWIWPAFLVVGFSALRGELRFYWTAPAFLPLIPWMLYSVSRRNPRPERVANWLRGASIASVALSYALFTFALFFPVGEYFRTLVESYRTYDIRFSPRGDIEGWRELISELRRKGLPVDDPDTRLTASDFRIVSQVAWATGTRDMGRMDITANTKNQYSQWAPPPERRFRSVLMFRDNRYPNANSFQARCNANLTWQDFPYVMSGKTVKIITWAYCDSAR